MRKTKSLITLFLTLVMFITSLSPCFSAFASTVTTPQVSGKRLDYSNVSGVVDPRFSYGTLIWNANTTLKYESGNSCSYRKIMQNGQKVDKVTNVTGSSSILYHLGCKTGETIKVRLTNCAVDVDGKLCDVILSVTGITNAASYPPAYAQYNPLCFGSITAEFYGTTRDDDGTTYDNNGKVIQKKDYMRSSLRIRKSTDVWGDLVYFWYNTDYAMSTFTMQYVLAGTKIPANIESSIGTIYDMDASGNASYLADKNPIWGGNEGIMFNTVPGDMYYDTKGNGTVKSWLEQDTYTYNGVKYNGVRVPSNTGTTAYQKRFNTYVLDERGGKDTNMPAKATSVILCEDLVNGKFDFRYTGASCGIGFTFASPLTFDTPDPVITVTDTKGNNLHNKTVYEDEIFNYNVSQYVPNNAFAKYYTPLFPNLAKEYTAFTITDTLSDDLTIENASNAVKIYNDLGKDVTSKFTISVSGQTVTARAKSNMFTTSSFYSHTYKLVIPVSFTAGVGALSSSSVFRTGKLTENASADISINKVSNSKNTNNVVVGLKYDVRVNSSIDNGEIWNVRTGETTDKGSTAVTDILGYKHGAATEKVTANFTVPWGYRIKTATLDGADVTSKLSNTNGVYSYTIAGESAIKSNVIHDLEVATERIPVVVTSRYVDTNGKELATAVHDATKFIGDSYSTNAKTINGYNLQAVPSNASGTADSEQITVTYVYTKRFDMAPVIAVDKNSVYENETFVYTYTQEVPASADYGKYKSFVMETQIDENLIVDKNNIRVMQDDKISYDAAFTVSVVDNKITLTATNAYLKGNPFYGHTYYIYVPVLAPVGSGLVSTVATAKGVFENTFTTKATDATGVITKNTDAVNTKLKYDYTIDSSIDRGQIWNSSALGSTAKDLKAHTAATYEHSSSVGAYSVSFTVPIGYRVKSVMIDGKAVDVNSLTLKNGVYSYVFGTFAIKQNTAHTVVVKTEQMYKLTVHYVDTDGKKLADDVEIWYNTGDEYKAQEKKISRYFLTDTKGTVSGIVNKSDIEVTYVYSLSFGQLPSAGSYDGLLYSAAVFIFMCMFGTTFWYVKKSRA